MPSMANVPQYVRDKVIKFVQDYDKGEKIRLMKSEYVSEIGIIWDVVYFDDRYCAMLLKEEPIMVVVASKADAEQFVRRRKIAINNNRGPGAIDEYCLAEDGIVELLKQTNKDKKKLFATFADNDLLELGVPEDVLELVRNISIKVELDKNKEYLPNEAFNALSLLQDYSLEEAKETLGITKGQEEITSLSVALRKDINKESFADIPDEALERVMVAPLEYWRIFLHPMQQKLVECKTNGPYRVLGGAGTGKTVVGMHRAKYLASKLSGNEKILFTTYTSNLASDIKENLKKICSETEMSHIDVINLDAWVIKFLKSHGYTYIIKYYKDLEEIWKKALKDVSVNLNFRHGFYADEWANVVAAQKHITRDEYIFASRIGRGTRLDRKKRLEVWSVFEKYIELMKDRKVHDVDTAMYECRLLLEKEKPMYSHIIVDEGQDFTANAFRLLRAMAGEEHKDDLFILADTHQRIYMRKVILSKCGIFVTGRSSKLRINYRTTEETRKAAFSLLKGIPFDDLDGVTDSEEQCRSLRHGEKPIIKNFETLDEECAYIVKEINDLIEHGIKMSDICVVARTKDLLIKHEEYLDKTNREQQSNKKLMHLRIEHNDIDKRYLDGIRFATMHRVKGLEFQYIFVVDASKGNLPLEVAIRNIEDPASLESAKITERCLLYVAITRAQKRVYITSHGTQSELLSVIAQTTD
jgi:superfamily I DNA/RNA helicase